MYSEEDLFPATLIRYVFDGGTHNSDDDAVLAASAEEMHAADDDDSDAVAVGGTFRSIHRIQSQCYRND